MDDARLQLKHSLERYLNAAREAAQAEAQRNEAAKRLETVRAALVEATKALQSVALAEGDERLISVGDKVVVVTPQAVTIKKLEKEIQL